MSHSEELKYKILILCVSVPTEDNATYRHAVDTQGNITETEQDNETETDSEMTTSEDLTTGRYILTLCNSGQVRANIIGHIITLSYCV